MEVLSSAYMAHGMLGSDNPLSYSAGCEVLEESICCL